MKNKLVRIYVINLFAQHTFAHRLPMFYSSHNSNLIHLNSMKLTRALEGGRFCPRLFFANNLKTATCSAAKFGVPEHNLRKHLVCKF